MTTILLAVVMFVASASTSTLAAEAPVAFSPVPGTEAIVEINGPDVLWTVSEQARTERGSIHLETEKPPKIAVDSYDFSGRLGFSIRYVDEGMGSHTISRVFTFSPVDRKFVERFPSCADEFYDLRVEKRRRRLISTYYENNVPKTCSTRLARSMGEDSTCGICNPIGDAAGQAGMAAFFRETAIAE